MTRKLAFLWIGVILVLIALPLRFNPRCILPSSYGWSGDFATSEWGERVSAFADITDMFIAAGLLMVILSFTRLTDARDT